ncbi:hypothetical protein [Novipirellula caenicola]|uniref:Nucleotide-diphospho-sugar transferase n=1 Tax=Novipirellula caenicola TaxID=1536901 RepID=A0ABP9VTU6_9BACT
MANPPIIFTHYGNSRYLPYVLETARLTNPDKEVVLLGDEKNRWIGKQKGITHRQFRDFDYGDAIDRFDRCYRPIQGPQHHHIKGGEDWLKFVFKRWFFVHNFLVAHQFDSFWHFDSDTMILESLADHEAKFESYECTEQCNGQCVNGYVSGSAFVSRYLQKINSIFEDTRFLEAKQQELESLHPNWAFTEMSAYECLKQDEQVRSIPLSSIIDGTTFDDCICHEHGMQMERLFNGREIKKIYCSAEGGFYGRNATTGEAVRMITLNFSWVPVVLFDVIFRELKKRQGSPATSRSPNLDSVPSMNDIAWRTHRLHCLWWQLKNGSRKLRKSRV